MTAESSLLQKVQAMMKVESSLTATMDKVEPWLKTTDHQGGGGSSSSNRPRVRPIPNNMEQVNQVLAVARTLAARTSAPAGWNPNAPVVGFSTPSPLPHQLRGGALAALQLERARQAERDRKRQREQQQQQEEEQMMSNKAQRQEAMDVDDTTTTDAAAAAAGETGGGGSTPVRDPKRREINAHEKQLDRDKSDIERIDAETRRARAMMKMQQQQQQQQQQRRQQQDVSMNLSDSSSSSSDDDDNSDDN